MRRKTKVYLLVLVAALLSLHSCKDKREELTLDYNYGYYPIELNAYIDYDVDSITYLFNNTYIRDTARYQLRELVADTFYDNSGNLNYELHLLRRTDTTSGWTFWKKWYISRDLTRVLKTEDDLKFIKMIFPPKSGESWNGNQYIPNTSDFPYDVYKDWDYHFGNIDSTVTVNGQNFDQAVSVSEVDEESFVAKRLRREVYAKGVGMIYQEWESLVKQNVQKDWNDGPESGFRIRMRIREHNP